MTALVLRKRVSSDSGAESEGGLGLLSVPSPQANSAFNWYAANMRVSPSTTHILITHRLRPGSCHWRRRPPPLCRRLVLLLLMLPGAALCRQNAPASGRRAWQGCGYVLGILGHLSRHLLGQLGLRGTKRSSSGEGGQGQVSRQAKERVRQVGRQGKTVEIFVQPSEAIPYPWMTHHAGLLAPALKDPGRPRLGFWVALIVRLQATPAKALDQGPGLAAAGTLWASRSILLQEAAPVQQRTGASCC